MSEFLSLLIAGIVFGAIYAVSASRPRGHLQHDRHLQLRPRRHGHGAGLPVLAAVAGVGPPDPGVPRHLPLSWRPGARVARRAGRHAPAVPGRTPVSVWRSPSGYVAGAVALAGSLWTPDRQHLFDTPEFFNGNPVYDRRHHHLLGAAHNGGAGHAVAVFLRVFFTRTRTGVAMRAVVDDPQPGPLSGASAGRVSGYAWMIGHHVRRCWAASCWPRVQGMNIRHSPQLVIYGYAAAVVGRLRSLPLTFLGAMILGVANSWPSATRPPLPCRRWLQLLPMALLLIVLVIMPEERLQIGRVVKARPPRTPTARQSTAVPWPSSSWP